MKLSRPISKQPPETIVALIDVVFFLLVFFMLIGRMDATAPFDVTPPSAETGADMPSGGITVSVSAAGDFAVDGLAVADGALNEVVAQGLSASAETLVRINAHRDTELRHVLPLVSRIEGLGAKDVVLVVTPEATPPIP
ncbi:biopolymer transporter ExbD [Marivita sp. XM-24bin2]|jgi:biopolymer transport protein ExbD|uniref:ExbD/TolR family protein n=1 Tax=unclassified Marivita TaxID=2632480 RepID=UPI000D797935|nr:biopolymer transporter ExbD [Marivita sp. XM-24bin2]MCR9108578.1 biopolymer transporter ExbD [Paracoccaceae bacterium]PWL36125.1 MAG: biopolymer transporter ExbD [Marivita sp. XM-24bin2]